MPDRAPEAAVDDHVVLGLFLYGVILQIRVRDYSFHNDVPQRIYLHDAQEKCANENTNNSCWILADLANSVGGVLIDSWFHHI